MGITVVSWNIAKRHASWRQLRRMDADVAILQEAMPPLEEVVQEDARPLDIGPARGVGLTFVELRLVA